MSANVPRRKDQRRFGRRPVAIQATVEFQYRSLAACVVHNLSEGGALIELIDQVELPQTFVLRLHTWDAKIPCQWVRADGKRHGIAFKSINAVAALAVQRAIRESKEAMTA